MIPRLIEHILIHGANATFWRASLETFFGERLETLKQEPWQRPRFVVCNDECLESSIYRLQEAQ